MPLLADIPSALDTADRISNGLAAGGYRFQYALSLAVIGALAGWIIHLYTVRVRELQKELRELTIVAYKLLGAVDILNRVGGELQERFERLQTLLLERLPPKKPKGGGP